MKTKAQSIHAQAEAYALNHVDSIPELQSPVFEGLKWLWWASLRDAFIKGASAATRPDRTAGRKR